MHPALIVLLAIVGLLIVLTPGLLISTHVVYKEAFYVKRLEKQERSFLKGEQYIVFQDEIKKDVDEVLAEPYEEISIASHDGKRLQGYLYIFNPESKKVQIQFHGYKGEGRKSMGGYLQSAKENGLNCIITDHRSHGKSEGHIVTYGIKERKDVKKWVEKAIEIFGEDCEILLRGISMGGATVLSSLDTNLPSNVKGVISDCPFCSPIDELTKIAVEEKTKMPEKPARLMLILAARIWAHFNVLESSAEKAVMNSNIPILLFHGDDDRFVPYAFSQRIAKANPSIRFITIPGAGHGLCKYKDPVTFKKEVNQFIKQYL